MPRIRVTILALFALALLMGSVCSLARGEESVAQLISRADSAPPGNRPALYVRIARQQAEAADKFYLSDNPEAGNAALKDVVTYSEKASDAAAGTGKKLKDTEIALRKMAEKFRDIKHNLPFDDQAPVQDAIDRLEKMRTDLLSAMFGKRGKK
jgi:hypothetical protein